jgi:tetratricopeptide (TPR) repeat protein
MKKIIIFLIIAVIPVFNLMAIDLQGTIKEGNNFYSKNEFDKAIEKYKEVLKEGYTSSALYFNLGNAYFKTKDINNAILYFERAKILAPSDKDINYNLELAKSFTVDKIEAIPEVFLLTWFHNLRDIFSLPTWTSLSILLFIITLIAFLGFLLSNKLSLKKISFWFGVVMLILTIWSFSSAYSHYTAQTSHNTAIVFSPTVNIKSSPAESGNNLFILHEGTKVEILDKVGEWSEIRIVSGARGFIKTSDLEII